jgi:uncharacterized protein YndB with AHSA1/START domain
MSVKKEANGRRSVQVEVEVPGTPEQVWQAIATGPGVSAWFVPTRVETDAKGVPTRVFHDFGAGMGESGADVTAWEPLHRFAAESPGWVPNSPVMATEWTIEAKSGGTCIVRVVHSLFADTDDWDGQLTGTESGWPAFFRVLKLYLTHFAGQPSALIQIGGMAASTPESAAWQEFSGKLGIGQAAAGQRLKTSGGAVPTLAGVVEQAADSTTHYNLIVRTEQPAPGVAILGVYNCGGPIQAMLSYYIYGKDAATTAKRDEPVWRAWMTKHFPMPQG